MPVLYIRRGGVEAPVNEDAMQTVGTLEFLSPTTVQLSSSAFPTTGTYALFGYTSFPGGAAALASYVTVTHPTLTPVSLRNNTTLKRVLVDLV